MRILRACLGLLFCGLLTGSPAALPTGPDITSGAAAIQQANGQLIINQTTGQAIIQWQGFSIGAGETVQFIQPGALSAVLNRVVGADPSVILGALRANGQVFLINPNGVVFGQDAIVDVSGLVVSTLGMSDQDFLNGSLNFTQGAGQELAAIVNEGTLSVKDNGFVVLLAPTVSNQGLIIANQGKVALGATEQASISFDPNQLIHFEIADLNSEQSKVLLPQQSVADVLSGVVSQSQISEATELVEVDGQWELVNGSGVAINDGSIIVDGANGEDAGSVTIDSSRATILTGNSNISASGQGINSDGGRVLLLSQGLTEAQEGSLVDIGAGSTGDGGFAELSGKHILPGLSVVGTVTDGATANYLIDPTVLTVANGPDMGALDTVYEEDLESSAVNISLLADETIIVEDIADDEISLMSGVNIALITTEAAGQGIVFEDSEDTIATTGTGIVSVDSASDIGPSSYSSEASVSLLSGGDIGIFPEDGVNVSAPFLSVSASGEIVLNTNVDSLSGSSGSDFSVIDESGIFLDGVFAGERFSLRANGDIFGDVTAGDSSLIFSNLGIVGEPNSPLVVDISGDLLVSAGDELNGRSVYLNGSVAGLAQVVDTTPGDATLNGDFLDEISILSLGEVLEDFDEEDIVNLADEFGLDDDDIEELAEQLGLSADDARFGEGGPGEGGPGEGKGKDGGPEGKGKQGKDGKGGTPLIAQAGLGRGQLNTSALLKVRLEQLPQLAVTVQQPSPFDQALTQAQLRADDLMDLSALDLSGFEVNLSYDLSGDPILINPNLSAGDLFELQVAELSEVPVAVDR